ncbi:hypothetical protein GXW71_23400 [Roseomonas hellenica]|uniref:Uncharacterized protein n=1 Tax=Plastoroseomonas hellenica TaxID=2687306 RepID=A0ABS5F421_9PROT|nr:hypothetical protein [Plastoroseomonas hellenica]MBR0667323.1 hypothetical protein [Plastoroseomonas hellenica]
MTALALSTPGLFAALDRRQPLLARAGWASLALLLLCLAAMTVDARLINGVSVWTKPAKFAASFVVWFWTLAWAWGVLEPAAQRGATARLVLWGTLAAAWFEMGWITLRGALGQPSHFATDPLGDVMYQLMGAGAVTLVALAATLGVLVLRRGDATRQARGWIFAIGWGLVLTGILGGLTGATISGAGTSHIGGMPSDAANLPPFYWSRNGGDLRIAHFLGVHAMQALPALALLLPGASTRLLALGAAGWTAMTLAVFAAGLLGVPLP